MKLILPLLFALSTSAYADVLIVNGDSGGEGFNDTTPATPVGGNPGTTLGQQRLNVFQKAADILNATYDISVDVRVASSFDPLSCNSSSAVLGQAGPAAYEYIYASRDVIPHALYNQQAGYDTDSGYQDINAQFNSSIDNNNSCLFGTNWYYGYDEPVGSDKSLLSVVLHEIMHGMGFLSTLQSNGQAGGGWTVGGSFVEGFDPYTRQLKDAGTGQNLIDQGTSTRAAVMKSVNNLVWGGTEANALSGSYSSGTNGGAMKMYAPSTYESGSSVSHFDTSLSPNELMEPAYTEFLSTPGLGEQLLVDIGWAYNSTPAPNNAPVLSAIGNQSLAEDTSDTVALSATDADGDSLSYSLSSANASLGASISGSTLTLNPVSNYHGTGSLTIQVSDGTDTDSETISVTVTPVNDAPVFAATGNQSMSEDTSANFTLNASDVDGDSLTYSIQSSAPSLGASISGNVLTASPLPDYNGNYTVTVQVSDGSLTDTDVFTITVNNVNDAPVLAAVSSQSLNEDTSTSVSLSATDADGDSLSYSIDSADANLGASVSGSTLYISPVADYNGSGTIVVRVSDGSLADTGNVSVTVNPVNDAPALAAPGNATVNFADNTTVTLSGSDIDGDSLTYSAVSADTGIATVAVSGNQLTITATGNTETSTTVTVTVSDGSLTDDQTMTVTLNDPATADPLTAGTGGTVLNDGDTLEVSLNDVAVTLAGGTESYSATLFFDGADRSELLSQSASVITVGMPESGAFAGLYRLDVDDGNTTATFWLERPLRLSSSVSPLLAGSDASTLTIEGAPVSASVSLAVSPAGLTFADNGGTTVSSATAPDDAQTFNAIVLTLLPVASGTTGITASASNIPDSELDVATVARRTLTLTVRDENNTRVPGADVQISDERFAEWGLEDSYQADSTGSVTLELPALDIGINVSAEGFADATVELPAAAASAVVNLDPAATLYAVRGQIDARGFTFSNEAPRISVRLSDGSLSTPDVEERSNTRLEYNWSTSLSGALPEALVVSHSAVPEVEIPLNPAFSEESVDILLAVAATEDSTESGAGNGLWLLAFGLLALLRRSAPEKLKRDQ